MPAPAPFCRWIEELARRGVTGGCGGGNYCPTAPVTREQMAVFLLTLDRRPTTRPPAPAFTDVPRVGPVLRWIEELVRPAGSRAAAGDPLTIARPPVTRGQMAVFLTKTVGLQLYGAD